MRDDNYNRFNELNWRRRLNPAERAELQAFLAAHPEAAGQWRADEALSRALEQLPQAPVSSNFTSRVLAAAQRAPTPARNRTFGAPWFLRGWAPRLAAGLAMVGVGFFSFHAYDHVQRERAGRQLATASRLASLPPIEWLNDFDTIQRLDRVKVADDDLLSALE